MDTARETYCYLMDIKDTSGIKRLVHSIHERAQEKIPVYLDNNILPYASAEQLSAAPASQVLRLAEFNSGLVNKVLSFADDRVILTADVREEMLQSVRYAQAQIAEATPNSPHAPSLDKLAKTYEQIARLVKPRAVEQGGRESYLPLFRIVKELVRHFPGLKKEEKRSKETDERLVAKAFSRAIESDQKVYLFTNDTDIYNLSEELFRVLVAQNMGGGSNGHDIWTGSRLLAKGVEVFGFFSEDQAFRTKFSKDTAKLPAGYNWSPPKCRDEDYDVNRIKQLRQLIWQNVLAIEEDALENPDITEARKAVTETEAGIPLVGKPAQQKSDLDILHAAIRLEDLAGASQAEIAVALESWEALNRIYEALRLPKNGFESELMQVRGSSFPYQIAQLTAQASTLLRTANSLTYEPDYMGSVDLQDREASMRSRIQVIFAEKRELEQRLEHGCASQVIQTLSPAEQTIYDGLKSAGYDILNDVGVPTDVIMTVTGRKSKAGISILLKKLAKEQDLLRKPDGRAKFNFLKPEHLSFLVKRRGK